MLERKIIKKVKQLKYEMTTLPAYARKEKIEKNKARLFAISIFAAVIGIIIFSSGWLAVPLTGAALSIIIVECGLLSFLSLPFIVSTLYNAYLGIQNLFNSEKIKSQNKIYDQCQHELTRLKKLAREKESLSTKINSKLEVIITSSLLTLSANEKKTFCQLSLKEQIKQLEQEKMNHPAYLREQKDKQARDKFVQSAYVFTLLGGCIYSIVSLLAIGLFPASIISSPILPGLALFLSPILILVQPLILSRLFYGIYLEIRDLFSSDKVSAEKKNYMQLKKTIAELKKLNGQLTQLDDRANSQLQIAEALLIQVTNKLKQEKNSPHALEGDYSKNNEKFSHYGSLFQLASSANQLEESESDIQPLPSLAFNYSKIAFIA